MEQKWFILLAASLYFWYILYRLPMFLLFKIKVIIWKN
jgi:hypothetical protein